MSEQRFTLTKRSFSDNFGTPTLRTLEAAQHYINKQYSLGFSVTKQMLEDQRNPMYPPRHPEDTMQMSGDRHAVVDTGNRSVVYEGSLTECRNFAQKHISYNTALAVLAPSCIFTKHEGEPRIEILETTPPSRSGSMNMLFAPGLQRDIESAYKSADALYPKVAESTTPSTKRKYVRRKK